MRILIVTDAWHPQVNGVVRALDTTAARLRDLGHQVEVIGPDRFVTLPLPTYPDIRIAVTSQRKLREQIEAFAPDAIHVATEGPLGWQARHYLKSERVPFTTSFHTMFPQYVRMRVAVPESVTFAYLRRFHSAARATMVSTPTLQRILESHGFRNIVRWVRGVDTDLFRPETPVELPGGRPHMMYVGRVAVEKNLEDFLDLQAPGTKFVVGDGPALTALRRRYKDVRFLGAKSGSELISHYSAADVFVFPSRTETLGLVMLEALACGVPVAAYPVQGPVDIVGSSGAGALNENLASAVAQAMTVDRSRCRERALEFSWDRSVAQFLQNLAPITHGQPVDAISAR